MTCTRPSQRSGASELSGPVPGAESLPEPGERPGVAAADRPAPPRGEVPADLQLAWAGLATLLWLRGRTWLRRAARRRGWSRAGFWAAVRQRRWPRMAWPLEVLVCVFGNAAYEQVQALAQSSRAAAFQHAHQVEQAEPGLFRSLERHLNSGLSAHPLLATAAGYYYTLLHLTVAVVVLVWLWRWHPLVYARARTVLFVMSMAALAVFWLYPVAPPRLSVPGAVDTLVQQHIFGAAGGSNVHGLVNLYAAMPSLHVAWATWCAWAAASALRGRWRWLVWTYPVLTTLVVLSTANHYLLDVLAGALTLVLVATLVPRSAPPKPQPSPSEPEAEAAAVG